MSKKRHRTYGCGTSNYDSLERRNLLATFVVNTTADVIDPADGLTSLREAVIESNSNGEDDSIVLAAGTYQLSLTGFGEDDSQTGDLDILEDGDSSVEFFGDTRETTIIDGLASDRVFDIHGTKRVAFYQLTITNGGLEMQEPRLGRRGAGIKSAFSRVTLDDVVVSSNQIGLNGNGGGLYVAGGSVMINNSQFIDNAAANSGGAIFSRSAAVTVNTSTIAENSSDLGATIHSQQSTLRMARTKVDLNSSVDGLWAFQSTLDLFRTRFRANHGIEHAITATNTGMIVNKVRVSETSGSSIVFNNDNVRLDVIDSQFIGHRGYGIEFRGSFLEVKGSLFTSAQRQGQTSLVTAGGGILIERTVASNTIMKTLVVEDTEFSRLLRADQTDGLRAIQTNVELQSISITGSSFDETHGTELTASGIFIEGSTFSNTPDLIPIRPGRSGKVTHAINATSNTFRLENSTLSRNGERSVVIQSPDATVDTSTFSNNESGAIEFQGDDRSLTVRGSIFEGNFGDRDGAGIYTNGSNADINVINSKFSENETDFRGGAAVQINGNENHLTIANSEISRNITSFDGVILVRGDQNATTITNSLIANNIRSGAVRLDGSANNLDIFSSTLVGNGGLQFSQSQTGIEAAAQLDSTVSITNSILISNGFRRFNHDDASHFTITNTAVVDHDDSDGVIAYGGAAANNTDQKPHFVDYNGGDFRLQQSSPLRDLGDDSALVDDVFDLNEDGDVTDTAPDLDLLDRVIGLASDLGAFELVSLVL